MFRSILPGYTETALFYAEYNGLDDGTSSGSRPGCEGVIAFGRTLKTCEGELQSTPGDWTFGWFEIGSSASCN